MKKVLIGGGAVILLGAGALLAAPNFIDWNQYRDEVATALELATGRSVAIAGDLDLALLPKPVLSASGVSLRPDGAQDGDAAPLAEIRAVDLSVRPWALLRGEVQVEKLSLVEPRMRVELLPGGDMLMPIDPGALGGNLRIDRLDVRKGTLTLVDRRGVSPRQFTADEVTGTADAGGADGPYHFNGSFALRGQPLSLDVTSGRMAAGQALPLRLVLGLPDGAAARFSGMLDHDGQPGLEGEIQAQGNRLSPMIAAVRTVAGQADPDAAIPAGDQPFTLRARLDWQPALLALDGIEASVGDSRAVGSAEIPLQAADRPGSLVLSFTQLDLDAWTGGELPALPTAARFDLDLLADAVILRGGALRDASLVGRLEEGTLTLERAAATLPGGTAVSLDGAIAGSAGRPDFDLALSAETETLRDTLAWAGLDVANVPLEWLRHARLKARVQGHPLDLRLSDVEAELDTTKLTGALSYNGMGRPGIGLRLDADRLDLDAYLGDQLPPAGRIAEWAQDVDLNLEAGIGHLRLGGIPVEGLALSGTLAQGVIELRELSAKSAAGMSGRISGRVGGLFPLKTSTLMVTAQAETLAPLFRALELTPPVPPERLGAVTLNGRMVGDAARMALEVNAGFLDGTVQAGGELRGLDGKPEADLKLRGTFPELVDVVRLARPEWQPGTPRLGGMDLYAELSGPADDLSARSIMGTVGPTTVSGEAALDRTGDQPSLTARLTTGPLEPAMFLPALGRTDTGIDLSWTENLALALELGAERLTLPQADLEKASLAMAVRDGSLDIHNLSGLWRGGELELEGRLKQERAAEGSGPPPAAASLRLKLANAEWPEGGEAGKGVGLSGGRFDLDFEGEGKGADLETILRGLAGAGRFTLRDTVLTGLDLQRLATELGEVKGREPAEALLKSAISGGRTPVARVEGPVSLEDGGLATKGLTAESPAGELTLTGRLNLGDGMLEAELGIDPAAPPAAPALTVALSGPITAPERRMQADDLLAWAAARAAFVPPPPLIIREETSDGLSGPPAPAARPPAADMPAAEEQPLAQQPLAQQQQDQPDEPPPGTDRDRFIKGILDKLKDGSGS